jgi:hypothetical protein
MEVDLSIKTTEGGGLVALVLNGTRVKYSDFWVSGQGPADREACQIAIDFLRSLLRSIVEESPDEAALEYLRRLHNAAAAEAGLNPTWAGESFKSAMKDAHRLLQDTRIADRR